jgi:hypothetical protein
MAEVSRFVYSELSKDNLQRLLREHGYNQAAEDQKWTDSMVHFLHTVISKIEMNQCDEDQFVNLHSDILGETYGQRKEGNKVYYKGLVNMLRNIGVIQTREYTVGVRSIGYRIAAKFTSTLVEEKINQDSFKEKDKPLTPITKRHLEDIKRLLFNVEMANDLVQRLHLTQRLGLTSWVYRWAKQTCTASQDDNARIYSNLTGLNKQFRGCLSYNGKDLFSVDLKQAHPFLFIDVLRKTIKQNTKRTLESLANEEKYQDVFEYIQDVRSEQFLPKIHDRIIANKKQIEWGELKVGVLAEVYYQRLKKKRHKIVKAFEQLYPTVWHYIVSSKQKDYKDLAKRLMTAESTVMNSTVRELYKRHPDGLFIRLHDAIITTQEGQEQVKEALERIAINSIGYSPKVTLEQFNVVKGEVADHMLTFEELINQFAKDQSHRLEQYYDTTTRAVYIDEITWVEHARRIDLKETEMINPHNLLRWLQTACLLKL